MRPKEAKFQKARPALLPVLEGSTGACFIVRDKNGQARWRMSI
jgi:hypothetical protein